MMRRRAPLLVSGCLFALLVVVASVAPTPYVTIAPGGAYNTLGSVDGVELISITGTTTHPTSGNLDLTTVSEAGGPYGVVTVGDLVAGVLDPDVRVVPREQIFPDTVNLDDVGAQNAVAFDESEGAAVTAAMAYLNIPVTPTVEVVEVLADGPSAGVVKPGNLIMAVDGQPVAKAEDVGRLVREHSVGEKVVLTIRPDRESTDESDVTVTTAPRPDDPAVPFLGITTVARPLPPFTVKVELAGVGGPSAGMMLSLGMIDKLTPGQLNGGRNVAGTGTISDTGEVGAIGGIAQKMVAARSAGADLFLAPADNCSEVVGAVPEGLTVVPVSTLTDAVTVLETWVAGRPVASCAR